jgi:hypothetical protein
VRGRQLLLNGEKEKEMLHCTLLVRMRFIIFISNAEFSMLHCTLYLLAIYPAVFSMLNLGRPCRKRSIIGENEIHLIPNLTSLILPFFIEPKD